MARDLTLALRLLGDSSRLDGALRRGQTSIKRFTSAAKREFHALQSAVTSLQGKLAGLGLGLSAAVLLRDSAMLTRNLAQTQRTAKMTTAEVAALRAEFFKLGRQTAVNPEALQAATQSLVAAGLSKSEALGALPAIARAMGTTKAEADILAKALTVASEQFKFDLSKPGQALKILDQMAKAADLGSAELQNLSDIFARVGQRGVSAGFNFQQTLAFIEALSKQEKEPERLATLADSLLRLWTNTKYMEDAAQGAGVKFFTAKGARRDPVAILTDFRNKFQQLKTDVARTNWINEVVGKTDMDTIKGFAMFMQTPGMIESFAQFRGEIDQSAGFLEKGLSGALNNAIDQAERLKIVMREAAESFTKPVEDVFNKAVKWALDEKQLSGGEIAGGAAAAVAGTYALGRFGKGILGRLGGTATGIMAGKAVEAAAGVTPVWVTNWPGEGFTAGAGAGAGAGKAADKKWNPWAGAGVGGDFAANAGAGAAAGAAASHMSIWTKLAGAVGVLTTTLSLGGSVQGQDELQARGEANRRMWAQKTATGVPERLTVGQPIAEIVEESAMNALRMLTEGGASAEQQIKTAGDNSRQLLEQGGLAAQQQVQIAGAQAAQIIQQQGQAAQVGMNAAADRFVAAAAQLGAALSTPQQVHVTVGVNQGNLNAWADRRAEIEGRRQ